MTMSGSNRFGLTGVLSVLVWVVAGGVLTEESVVGPEKGPWTFVSESVEFQAARGVRSGVHDVDAVDAATESAIEEMRRGLGGQTYSYTHDTSNPYNQAYQSLYADTDEIYDPFQQAWRLLGIYIDCNADTDSDYNASYACPRSLLFAAYVDLSYMGTGLDEYQFYNRTTDSWDTSSCNTTRCAKMDCHLKNTHWTLLGFFKCSKYNEWMEQLFKHEGRCVWTDEEYQFAQNTRELVGRGSCDITSLYDSSLGLYLYSGEKPLPGGNIGLGLYTDSRCSIDYQGSFGVHHALDEVYGHAVNYTLREEISRGQDDCRNSAEEQCLYELEQVLKTFNKALDIFKVCQPCVAYDLTGHTLVEQDRYDRFLQQEVDDNAFECHDDAGYKSVNQCMKFKTKTDTMPADFRDIQLAGYQNTITELTINGVTYGAGGFGATYGTKGVSAVIYTASARNSRALNIFFGASTAIFVMTLLWYFVSSDGDDDTNNDKKSPLLSENSAGILA